MRKYSQTIARLGAGLTLVAGVVWLLWPENLEFVDNPEAWFLVVTSFFVWAFVELRDSEEIGPNNVSQNDIRTSRKILDLHSGPLRYLLLETDLWSFVDSNRYSDLGNLCSDWKRHQFFFHNRILNKKLSDLMDQLDALSMRIAQDTVPVMVAGGFQTGYKPVDIVHEDEYQRRRDQSKVANEIATNAWKLLDDLARVVREKVPQALDKPL